MSAHLQTVSLIVNPTAGRTTAVAQAQHLAQSLSRRGWKSTVHTSKHPEDAVQLAQDSARHHPVVVAVGGDGTVAEVASGLLLAPPPVVHLALLPCGTGNDLAHQLGIRSSNHTLASITQGRLRSIDAIQIVRPALSDSHPRHALSFVAAGFAAELVRHTTPSVKRWFGRRLAYTLGFFASLIRFRSPSVEVRLDGHLFHGRFLHVCAGNAEWAGGGTMRISPGARLDDGCLNLCLIRAKNRREIINNFPRLLRGTFPTQPGVTYTTGSSLEVLPGNPLPLQADGSSLGVTPVRCTIRPGAVQILVPG